MAPASCVPPLAILATEFMWAKRVLQYARGKYDAWTDWLGRQSLVVRIAVLLATGLVVEGSAFLETLDARGASPGGAVCFTGATIGDDLVLQGARLIAGAGPAFNGDWYYAANIDGSAPYDRTDFPGSDRFYLITYNHRMAFVNAGDVTASPSSP